MKQASANILRAAHGFTLIEAMIAVAVLMLGVLALEKNFVAQTMGNNSSRLTTRAVARASMRLEELLALPLNDPLLQDSNGNGCGVNNQNLDDTIDGAGNVAADHMENLGQFTIFWNVCDHDPTKNLVDDDPVEGTIRIRMIIRWRDNNRVNNVNGADQRNNQQVVMDYVRGAL